MSQFLKCIIVEDEEPAQDILKIYIEKIPYLVLEAVCDNAFSALDYIAQNEVDIIFTDIHMPRISGIDMIKSLSKRPFIIITTAFSDYAVEGFDLDVTDFLVKPISFDRFLRAVTKVREKTQKSTAPATISVPAGSSIVMKAEPEVNVSLLSMYVKENGKLLRVDFDDILFVEGLRDYVKIITDGKVIITHMTMKKMEETLPSEQFVRVHKSHIVRIDAIKAIDGNMIEINNNAKIQIGLQFRDNVFKYIKPIN
ncbi:DNA-binding response regulator, LytR/AlgR family [Pseudarcicella hirudinis]|uniref:DNA-binding response regulator, LytR/AlgR family n=1 Tax=Pseudarcicella hirudinis TaxID=1079859 RepID=A0A1I5TI67_9BACT|nr:response regulator [Pseudarcicella hirudinis]SFP82628.1 DNA-binding response regulator, LytR/AlgR family [Pseudarcicella hirudinis]